MVLRTFTLWASKGSSVSELNNNGALAQKITLHAGWRSEFMWCDGPSTSSPIQSLMWCAIAFMTDRYSIQGLDYKKVEFYAFIVPAEVHIICVHLRETFNILCLSPSSASDGFHFPLTVFTWQTFHHWFKKQKKTNFKQNSLRTNKNKHQFLKAVEW